MRTLVDIPEKQPQGADTPLEGAQNLARGDHPRGGDRLSRRKRSFGEDDPAFGLWGDRKIDGLEYQRKIRSEW
ncbi:MAG: hypothetical protein WDM81_14885 [Rhizomicrobium sp.]